MNRTALITGAAIRIGNVIARTLARAGWNVVVHAHRSVTEADALCADLAAGGARAWRVTGDLADDGGPAAVFEAGIACAGQIDALINNAAVFERQPLASATAADFERLWRINTLAPILLTQRLAAHVTARKACGSAVNLLDQRLSRASAGALPYMLSKSALETFTLSAALEYAPDLRVNAVAPGAVLPPPAQSGTKEPAGAFPLGTRPAAEHVAAAVRFLLDAESVTGQVLFVDGGQHLTS
ncbi:MAG TPA: SDR family oxidoreductase [Kiritimatiellia bacterium]|nr:SDR family oxidoreductase [Kiritimatiellia bacterium]HPS08672.1 SDR family oxidoreductase [Kiritimatiellia bacterium]